MYSVILILLIDTATTYSCNFLLLCSLKAFNIFFGLYAVLMTCMHIYVCVCVSTLQRNFISAFLCFFHTFHVSTIIVYTFSWDSDLTFCFHGSLNCPIHIA